ncbi:DNA-binding response regulator [Sulfuricurvum sp.]|uniref:response regulator transcription factor n=1 Tax=Sulfuricurvum sp. TaxID=2025608 RepID=UPI002635BAA9|nr:DNA-binding response regulator [Sulfuricurvum sp.]MDD2266137.1 DNA-binding response regulator [Sulfuricurvum sp.]MDD2783168.1 DNA-binding response regulator [Sulfuricurvum sp.]
MISIVIVEDEILVAHFMSELLKKMGCNVVKIIHKFDNAIETISQIRPDILLLDINLGTKETKTAGITIAEALKDHNILTIFITAYSDERIVKDALMQNPENYIIKPFTEESIKISIQLALNKLQRRSEETVSFKLCQEYAFNAKSKYVMYGDDKIFLTSTELSALELLCDRSNKIITHEELQNSIWEFKSVSSSTVRELFSRLRKKIPCLKIQNHAGIGYELILRG